jgi:hypothetical protein
METLLVILGAIFLPILVNKTTERGRFEWVHPHLRWIWVFILVIFTYYVLEKPMLKSIATDVHNRFRSSPSIGYLGASVVGILLMCIYWWATGYALSETSSPAPIPTTQQPETPKLPDGKAAPTSPTIEPIPVAKPMPKSPDARAHTIKVDEGRPKPDIGAEFIQGTSPGLVLRNLSDTVLREPTSSISVWNLDTKISLPTFNRTETGMFIKPGFNGILIATVDNPGIKPLVKDGDHVFGFVTVDCAECRSAKQYWLYVVYGGESWYSPVPEGANVNVVKVARILGETNWDVEEFMKQVPHGDRVAPRKL